MNISCGNTPRLRHLHIVGAGRVSRLDDPLRDLGPGAPRHPLGLALDIGHI
jgi:hypothetical protein